PPLTVGRHFSGKTLGDGRHAHGADREAPDPSRVTKYPLAARRCPLPAISTAGYAWWLARSNSGHQSLRSLFGGKGGIDTPPLYKMEPYEPNRRRVVNIQGPGRRPEARGNGANEPMAGDGNPPGLPGLAVLLPD
ncbi:hypothetical protein DI494_22425, partial [Stenotrophomonas maltophilia]